MSEVDIMQKLADTASEISDKMSAEQLRLYHDLIAKKYELKLAEEAFRSAANIESDEDKQTGEILWSIRQTLEDKKFRLSGTEAVMLASYHKHLEGDEHLDTKRLNLFLQSFERKPANTTKIVDNLAKKRHMETRSDGMHSHKTFLLTRTGQNKAEELLRELSSIQNRDRLSVVD